MNYEKPKPRKPDEELQPRQCQHVRFFDCDKPVIRVIYECWHCKQGLLSEVEGLSPEQIEIPCPTCGRAAIRLMPKKVLSTTAIPSPWG
ncbi:hypothetical protein NIES4074_47390 [Cylindrospermum sp. NIES-4074]|jgi:DNA-directed RNA polymerase subunit RPC12/RpoP|nr:hypothetical protein NIES4074_47390 [Cylindrospermum sp. NIES-4074]